MTSLNTKEVGVKALEPKEDASLSLGKAPCDGVIANVSFKPSEELRGAYYTRELQLHVHRQGEPEEHVVATLQLGTDEVLLPADEPHNLHMLMPPTSLRVSKGDDLVWSSIGSVGEGLAVPSGTVKIVFEQKGISETESVEALWEQCVPEYWIGKSVLVEHWSKELNRPGTSIGSGGVYIWQDIGTFEGADEQVLQISVDPKEHGHLPRLTGFPHYNTHMLKLRYDLTH